jgi:hypothetical protein
MLLGELVAGGRVSDHSKENREGKRKLELCHAPSACGLERVGGEVNLVHVD